MMMLDLTASTCTKTNYYSSLSSSTINAVEKFNTGSDFLAVAVTVSSQCRILILGRTGSTVVESSIGKNIIESNIYFILNLKIHILIEHKFY